MYVAQQCFSLSDEGIEDTIHDSQAIRGFVGIDLAREAALDATTLLRFRRLLETQGLTSKIFEVIKAHLAEKGLMMREGHDRRCHADHSAPFDQEPRQGARSRDAPDEEGQAVVLRDEGPHRRRCRVGPGACGGRDGSQTHKLLHGGETEVLGDAGYQGVEKRKENQDTKLTWHIALKRSKRKALPANRLGKLLEKLERAKASLRAKVEHPFHLVKNLFKHKKTRYHGLAKNKAQLFSLFGLANLFLARRPLLALYAPDVS